MKRFILISGIVAMSAGWFALAPAEDLAKCGGKDPCKACKSCELCKHCNEEVGTCGVCKPKPPASR